MKNRLILTLILTLFFGASFAQKEAVKNKKDKRAFIQAEKVAFISTELDLTPDEAQVFWPIYNQYEAELDAIRMERRKYLIELRKAESLSAERAYELTEKVFKTEAKESGVRLKYLESFSKTIGKKKAAELFAAEEKFKHELLRKLRDDPRGGPPEGRP
jgi:hypothetical protein